jgi:FkbM family methyltransferase
MKALLKSAAHRAGLQVASSARAGIYHMVDIGRVTPLSSLKTIFDVGAHQGESSLGYVREAKNAQVFAFEPMRRNFENLVAAVAGSGKIVPVHSALGSVPGELRVHHGETSQTHSLVETVNSQRASGSSEVVNVGTVDEFCAANGIRHIDLLKTDTEGYDLEVLKGATSMLQQKAIDFVYSEVGFDPGDKQHTLFNSLFEFLTPHGFGFTGLYELSLNGPPTHIEYCNALFSRI